MSKKIGIVAALATIILFVALVGAIVGLIEIVGIKKHLANIEKNNQSNAAIVAKMKDEQKKHMEKIEEVSDGIDSLVAGVFKPIDLTINSSQKLTDGASFLVNIDEVKQQMTGVKISGKIINASSITYSGASFQIAMIGAENTINVPKDIPPGGSTKFSVYVPDVKPENSKYAKISFISGNISFY